MHFQKDHFKLNILTALVCALALGMLSPVVAKADTTLADNERIIDTSEYSYTIRALYGPNANSMTYEVESHESIKLVSRYSDVIPVTCYSKRLDADGKTEKGWVVKMFLVSENPFMYGDNRNATYDSNHDVYYVSTSGGAWSSGSTFYTMLQEDGNGFTYFPANFSGDYLSYIMDNVINFDAMKYDSDHDFRQDTYDVDMPIPELSKLSYSGFHVDNAETNLFLDVYIQTKFYGVVHGGSDDDTTGTLNQNNLFSTNKSDIRGSHRYNLTN